MRIKEILQENTNDKIQNMIDEIATAGIDDHGVVMFNLLTGKPESVVMEVLSAPELKEIVEASWDAIGMAAEHGPKPEVETNYNIVQAAFDYTDEQMVVVKCIYAVAGEPDYFND